MKTCFKRLKSKSKGLLFLSALLLVAPLVCCSKKTTKPPLPVPYLEDEYAAWSPDGRTIAYVHTQTQSGQGSDTISGIFLVDTSGTNERLLVRGIFLVHPTFSPDGNRLAFANGSIIWKIKVNGDSLTKVVEGENLFWPRWSPDGQFILFTRQTGIDRGIWITRPDGSESHLLISFGYYSAWSGDGQRIFCETSFLENGMWQWYMATFNLSDSTFRKITRFESTTRRYFGWKPDGSKIIFHTERTYPVALVFMDTLGHLTGTTIPWALQGSWSPDGKKVVYSDVRPGMGRIVISNEDGTERKQLSFPK